MDEQPLWERQLDELLKMLSLSPAAGDQVKQLKFTEEAFIALQLVHNRFECTDIGEALAYIFQTTSFFLRSCKYKSDRAIILRDPVSLGEALFKNLLIASQPASFFLTITALPPSAKLKIRALAFSQENMEKLRFLGKFLALDVDREDDLNLLVNHACKIGAWALTHITQETHVNIQLGIPLFIRESRSGQWFLTLPKHVDNREELL